MICLCGKFRWLTVGRFQGDFVTILECPSDHFLWRGRLDDGTEGLFDMAHCNVLGPSNSARVKRVRTQANEAVLPAQVRLASVVIVSAHRSV